jgi:hypothetical protein
MAGRKILPLSGRICDVALDEHSEHNDVCLYDEGLKNNRAEAEPDSP